MYPYGVLCADTSYSLQDTEERRNTSSSLNFNFPVELLSHSQSRLLTASWYPGRLTGPVCVSAGFVTNIHGYSPLLTCP